MTTDQPPFNLDDVVGNSKLERRLSKPPHYEAESNALIARTQTIAAANEASQFQIGERKRAEDQLQQLNNELERRVTDRTRDLIKANADLTRTLEERERLQEQLRQSQKMGSIGTLAGGLVHDFNNLLNVIRGCASAIMQHPDDPANVIEVGEVIVRTVDQGAELARQLLTMARKSEPKLDSTDLNGLLRGLTKLLSQIFPKSVTIALDLDAKLPNVMADANQINQALLNLCVNARDAMADGGNLLLRTRTISGAELRARFRDVKSERFVWISVADTGSGMEEEIKSHIFEPFFTTKDPEHATGLGLSMTHGIVAKQNGFIDVTSEPGRGSTFHIYLPIPKEQSPLVDEVEPVERKLIGARVRHPETLLFVEDEPRQLQLMQSFLKGEGFTVLTARDGAEAVEVHRRFKDEIAVVILDLGLAKMNGWQAFQMMKKLNPRVKGILASGYLSPDVESHLADGALSGVIAKPYRPTEVIGKIKDAIRSA
jgi:two-component system cell cycle sensor histidine kinase/response regulator CckA